MEEKFTLNTPFNGYYKPFVLEFIGTVDLSILCCNESLLFCHEKKQTKYII